MVLICTNFSQEKSKLQLNEKSNKSWHWSLQSFSLMQSIVCAVQRRLGCLWEIVWAKAHYHNELSSAGAPLYCCIGQKCRHFSASNWCWGRQVPVPADTRTLRNERFAQNIFLQHHPPFPPPSDLSAHPSSLCSIFSRQSTFCNVLICFFMKFWDTVSIS